MLTEEEGSGGRCADARSIDDGGLRWSVFELSPHASELAAVRLTPLDERLVVLDRELERVRVRLLG